MSEAPQAHERLSAPRRLAIGLGLGLLGLILLFVACRTCNTNILPSVLSGVAVVFFLPSVLLMNSAVSDMDDCREWRALNVNELFFDGKDMTREDFRSYPRNMASIPVEVTYREYLRLHRALRGLGTDDHAGNLHLALAALRLIRDKEI